jgi:hypothetical protein
MMTLPVVGQIAVGWKPVEMGRQILGRYPDEQIGGREIGNLGFEDAMHGDLTDRSSPGGGAGHNVLSEVGCRPFCKPHVLPPLNLC